MDLDHYFGLAVAEAMDRLKLGVAEDANDAATQLVEEGIVTEDEARALIRRLELR